MVRSKYRFVSRLTSRYCALDGGLPMGPLRVSAFKSRRRVKNGKHPQPVRGPNQADMSYDSPTYVKGYAIAAELTLSEPGPTVRIHAPTLAKQISKYRD